MRLLIAVMVTSVLACAPSTLTIGVLVGLSGSNGELGVSARNGVVLALEEWNERPEGAGPLVIWQEWDDQSDPQRVVEGLNAFRQLGIYLVIGPLLSSLGEVAVQTALANDQFLISPTISSLDFAQRDDPLFRLTPTVDQVALFLARAWRKKQPRGSVLALIDRVNLRYAQDFLRFFDQGWRESGQGVLDRLEVDSRHDPYAAVGQQVLRRRPDAVLLIVPGRYAAFLAQYLREQNFQGHFLLSGWTATGETLYWAGSALEGALVAHYFPSFESNPALEAFCERYLARFGQAPSFSAIYAYEATRLALLALERSGWRYQGWRAMRDQILELGPRIFVHRTIAFSKEGDITSEPNLFQVQGDRLVPLALPEP